MTVRKMNDDARCQAPLDCKASRAGVCQRCRQRDRTAKMMAKLANIKPNWPCPAGFEELYVTLKRKVGAGEARRMVMDEAARAERKAGATCG